MKVGILFFILLICFSAQSNNDIAVKNEVNLFLEVSECLRNIPSNNINDSEYDELTLLTSVIENLTVELGTNKNEQKEFRELYKIAAQYCEKEISNFKAEYKSMVSN